MSENRSDGTDAIDKIADALSRIEQARELDDDDLRRYEGHRFVRGWEISGALRDKKRRLRILLPEGFPFRPARFAVHPFQELLIWPNVEEYGVLCLAKSHYAVHKPLDLTQILIKDAVKLVDEVSAGEGKERFLTEFNSYWTRHSRKKGTLASLCDLTKPSRTIVMFVVQRSLMIADSEEQAGAWVRNRFGDNEAQDLKVRPAVFVALERPPYPREYPTSLRQLLALVPDIRTQAMIMELVADTVESDARRFVALSFPAKHGRGVGAVEVARPERNNGQRQIAVRGFRPGKAPPQARFASQANSSVFSYDVVRYDAQWIHGRDANPAVSRLQNKRVLLIGVGSLGAGVARLLIQSGVSNLYLCDGEHLDPENVSRHELGLNHVHESKTVALARELRQKYPHVTVDVLAIGDDKAGGLEQAAPWQSVFRENPRMFEEIDHVISMVGDWAAEKQLDETLLNLRYDGTVQYGWLEPRGLASHSLTREQTGCLSCVFDEYGNVINPVIAWDKTPEQYGVPACAGAFEPYGAIELASAQALVARHAIDSMLSARALAEHRVWIGAKNDVEEQDGKWNPTWVETNGEPEEGNRTVTCNDYPRGSCPSCNTAISATEAG